MLYGRGYPRRGLSTRAAGLPELETPNLRQPFGHVCGHWVAIGVRGWAVFTPVRWVAPGGRARGSTFVTGDPGVGRHTGRRRQGSEKCVCVSISCQSVDIVEELLP